MQVFFYLPEKYLPDAARQEAWKSGALTTLEEGGKIASAQAWIYQTWVEAQQAGCAATLTHELPAAGIMIALAGCFGKDFRPAPPLYFADVVADGLPHPGAHLHIVQNALHARKLPRSVYLPHWPHPNLLPRDPARRDRFENLGFFGDPANLAPGLRDPDWQKRLRDRTGLSLRIVGADGWHDYREMDAVLAVRGWGRGGWLRKPATKLYNAWLAGVPFLGGQDSAYRGDGSAGENYLAASSLPDLENCLGRLKADPALRRGLVDAGHVAARKFGREATAARWKFLLESTLPEAADKWRSRPSLAKALYWRTQAAAAWMDRTLSR
jgi:hypothetical protein